MQIEIFSDVACPWCFIGKRRFEAALAQFDAEVDIVYRSFELAPDTPVDFAGSEVDFLIRHKSMDPQQVEQMLRQMTQIAAAEGLSYDFNAVQHTNTRKAHELLHLAKGHGLQERMKERLLAGYFEQGRHVGRVGDLAALASEVGLEPVVVRAELESGVHAASVQDDLDLARSYGITGVPFYVIDARMGISGAQPVDTFLHALREAAR